MAELYRHSKGMLYLAIATAKHSETQELLVVYRTLYENAAGRWWVRPRTMFHELVERDGEMIPRFASLGTIRRARAPDMDAIYRNGFDAWGDGLTLEAHVARCAASTKYPQGTWYMLEDDKGNVVASAIAYRLGDGFFGIGTVTTDPARRMQRFGSAFVLGLMGLLEDSENARDFLLFSEISPSFYERLGFIALPQAHQHHLPSVAMLRSGALGAQAPSVLEAAKHYF